MILFNKKNNKIIILTIIILSTLILNQSKNTWGRAGNSRTSNSSSLRSSSIFNPGNSNNYNNRYNSSPPSHQTSPNNHQTNTTNPHNPINNIQSRTQSLANNNFLRGLTGGLIGGFIGGMIGNTLFGGGYHNYNNSVGLLEILAISLIIYLVYYFIFKRKKIKTAPSTIYNNEYSQPTYNSNYKNYTDINSPSYNNISNNESSISTFPPPPQSQNNYEQGITYIRSTDASFETTTFLDKAIDIFFKIQTAWSKKKLEDIRQILTEEMYNIFSCQLQEIITQGRTNILEQISIRSAEINNAWQEQGRDYITVYFYANLLDYTINDKNNEIIQGDNKTLIKFEEYWTFQRIIGSTSWKLTAVTQINKNISHN